MITPIRTIVAGVASLEEEDALLAPALRMADDLGATLHLVHAFLIADPLLEAYAGMSLVGPEVLERHRLTLQLRLEKMVASHRPAGRVVCHAVPGAADQAVLTVAEAERAELVVVGATRRGAISRALLGTTAQRVLRAASVPTLVVREGGHFPPRRVLIATDLSDLSRAVADRGLHLLGTLGGGEFPETRSLLVVGFDLPLPPPLRQGVLEEVAQRELFEFIQELKPAPRPVQARVRVGDPASEIVAESIAWGADLIVLGTHSRRGTSRFLIGSVAEATLRSALTHVLVIPAAAVADELRPTQTVASLATGGAR